MRVELFHKSTADLVSVVKFLQTVQCCKVLEIRACSSVRGLRIARAQVNIPNKKKHDDLLADAAYIRVCCVCFILCKQLTLLPGLRARRHRCVRAF
jgi:hypothetical protein